MPEIHVADSSAIPEGEVVGFSVDGCEIALARFESKVYAFRDLISHECCPLSTGWLEGNEIECERHGARFSLLTVEVTLPPATLPIPVYEVAERDGKVFVTLTEAPVAAK